MKILVKKNNGFVNLGEGKIYSKKQLILKEKNELIGDVTSNDETIQGASGLQNAVNKKTAENPTADGWSTDLSNLKQGNSAQNNGNGVMKFTQNQLNQPGTKQLIDRAAQTNPNMQITVMKNNSSLQTNSVTPRKVMDEMRKNSIPFTKKELHKFLMDL